MELEKKSDKVQVATFLTVIGEEGRKRYEAISTENEEDVKLKDVLEKCDAEFKLKTNVVIERHKFLQCKQKAGQTIEEYVSELR